MAGPPPPQQHSACAACKHRRRQCQAGCLLAPYFPADEPDRFRNAHRLFGVDKILGFMATAGPEKQDDCMKSIVYEVERRAADPVFRPCGVIRDARKELARAETELDAVKHRLRLLGHVATQPPSSPSTSSSATPDPPAAAAAPPTQQHSACAACRHRRQECAAGCPLAPYFPADEPRRFGNSHRLFGVKKILGFMTAAGPKMQNDCMKSIVYEAERRAADPVRGSCGVLRDLCRELDLVKAELDAVQEQLVKHQHRPARVQPALGSYADISQELYQDFAHVFADAYAELEAQQAKQRPAPVQQWMPPQPFRCAIPDEHQPPFYGDYAPTDAVKIEGDATVGVKVDEDAAMLMQHDDAGAVHSRGRLTVEMCHRRQARLASQTSESSTLGFEVQSWLIPFSSPDEEREQERESSGLPEPHVSSDLCRIY